jgi:hypothetical protein
MFGLLSSGVIHAYPITVTLIIPNAHGTLTPPNGPATAFTASSITFATSFDSVDILESPSGVFIFAPIIISVPGFQDTTISEPGANVTITDYGSAGLVRLSWPRSNSFALQGAAAQDPRLYGYRFHVFYVPSTIPGGTFNGVTTSGVIDFTLPSGEGVSVQATANNAMLTIAGPAIPRVESTNIPSLGLDSLVLLAALVSIVGGWQFRRSATRNRFC